MSTFYIKQNDTAPALQMTLTDPSNDPVDLTSAESITFHMRESGQAIKIEGEATVVDASAGTVKYDWAAGDTDTPGNYQCEVEITYTNGTVHTIPNEGYGTVVITEELD
jgi:Rib/alpha/Esp surface antigen-like repeat protein